MEQLNFKKIPNALEKTFNTEQRGDKTTLISNAYRKSTQYDIDKLEKRNTELENRIKKLEESITKADNPHDDPSLGGPFREVLKREYFGFAELGMPSVEQIICNSDTAERLKVETELKFPKVPNYDKLHSFSWALKQLKKSKPVKRIGWQLDTFCYFKSNDIFFISDDYETDGEWDTNSEDILANDWVLSNQPGWEFQPEPFPEQITFGPDEIVALRNKQ